MEIVAPAGDYSRFLACIKGGANSIYLGLKGVGARRKAPNFTLEELKEAIDFAHLKGVRVYLTLNTIYKDIEIENLYENLKTIYEWGVDAFIVQDIGMVKFIKENFPEVEIHGSTQMTVANHVEAEYYKKLGLKRIVLARELSFEEIKNIKEKCDIDLEIFVSGALCISYSGNCYFSSLIGSRSGNRGLCAQPCRKKYDTDKGSSYILSPKDQFFNNKEIEMLNEIGVESIKVEGRMKSEEYVYETVSYYRDILQGIHRKSNSFKIFNRGYSKGYFYENTEELMNSNFSFDLGYLLGIINNGTFILEDKLTLGDGIVYLDKNYNKVGGEYVSKIYDSSRNLLREAEKGQKISLNKIPKEAFYIHKTYDKEVYDNISKNLKDGKRRAPINVELNLKIGKKSLIEMSMQNIKVQVEAEIFEKAKNPLKEEKIKEKISELGETNFYLENFKFNYDGEAFISFSELKELKRKCVQKLEERIIESFRRKTREKVVLEKNYKNLEKKSELFISVLKKEQYDYLINLGYKNIFYKNPDVLRESNLDKAILDNKLCGNISQVLLSKEKKVWLDWNSNIINSYACNILKNIDKLEGIILSPEIKKEELEKIDTFSLKKGIVVYGKLRVMYIEKNIDDVKEIYNEQGDKLLLYKNELGNTEVYLDKELNLIPRISEIEQMGFHVIKIEFTFESLEEIKNVMEALESRKGNERTYNYESGLY